eukprot:CAMPEP_0206539132 /NCGR_PEP_ID=MMETSP0325_2-20121206/8267_1 /ASSEMBLY_ACC=CAM_ASM_000347 /TAXON_ID=2866 /ORGANISM="Crypthecodinium cohnii, Strain Seligo" /LENGTH=47 /DNA_ID= /DNA_START= /DNA_END= /DNA_ORIENTATION=
MSSSSMCMVYLPITSQVSSGPDSFGAARFKNSWSEGKHFSFGPSGDL